LERHTVAEMMAKGSYAHIILATTDLDCAFRDPTGNFIRINELRSAVR